SRAVLLTPIPRWNVDASGNWPTPSNWSAGAPNGAGTGANFDSAITAAQTVTLTTPRTVGYVYFENLNRYTLAGSTLTLDTLSGPAGINVVSGGHTISAPLQLAVAT